MNKDQSLNVMSYIDPALVESADNHRAAKLARKPIKIALIAACICVLLVGSVFAAAEILTGAGILSFTPDSDTAFTVEYKSKNFPLSAFSSKILENENKVVAFDSWEEAEEYIGLDIMDNTVLSNAEPSPCELSMTEIPMTEAGTLPHCYVYKGFDETYGLLDLWLLASYNINDVRVDVRAILYTESFAELYPENADGAMMNVHTPDVSDMVQEEYTGRNGLESCFVSMASPQWHTLYEAYFSIDGVQFILDVQCADSDAAALQTLKDILDAFVLE